MCGGVMYSYEDDVLTVYFPNPKAVLPVLKRDGDIELLPWGRRQQQAGFLPMGGWARLESIHQGKWDKYFPTPVKIPLLKFMEKDLEGTSHWFDVMSGQYVQGLIAHNQTEQRLYVVTIAPDKEDAIFHRWPRVVAK